MSDPILERRAAAEIRAAGRRFEGYAAVFGARAKIADFTETVAAGAFTATLAAKTDVIALVDHDPSRLLGRTASGTLRLAEDDRGLHFAIDVPDTALGRDMLAMVERGDVRAASFGFRVPKGGDLWDGSHRTLRQIDLLDVSLVQAFPAYTQTSVTARMRGTATMSIVLARRYLEMIHGRMA